MTTQGNLLCEFVTSFNLFNGTTVVSSAARIAHTLHHCKLSNILSYHLTSKNERVREREMKGEREQKFLFIIFLSLKIL